MANNVVDRKICKKRMRNQTKVKIVCVT